VIAGSDAEPVSRIEAVEQLLGLGLIQTGIRAVIAADERYRAWLPARSFRVVETRRSRRGTG